jgi:3-oxoacyl-[acyl-carrier protein] reductase
MEARLGKLDGKAALITGASRGIGRAIAETYGREGARIAVNYTADASAAEATVKAICAAGGEAVALQADVTDSAALRGLFEQAESAFGGLDIVVANAHPGMGLGLLTELTEEVIDQQLAVLKSYILTLQEAGRRTRDGGVIISITSAATRVAIPHVALYGSIKLAIEQLSRGLSRQVAPRGVRVLTLSPGLTRTDRSAGATNPPGAAPTEQTLFTRPAEPDDIADAALFLASQDARWVNAHTLYVNGGAVYAQ